jgi:hypothetical protein
VRRRHRWLERRASLRGKRLGKADKDLPVMQRAHRFGQNRPVETGDITHRKHIEGGVVMVVFQRRRGGQDQVGVARGLVDIEVDADHELQTIKGLFQLPAIWRRQHRITRHRHQCTDLSITFGKHFFSQSRHR